MNPHLPAAFTHRMQQLLNNDYEAFLDALQQNFVTAIRLNPYKLKLPVFENAIPLPWCPNAYYLPQRPNFTADPLLHAGAYYVQDASSMFIAEALKQCCNLQEPLTALDLCAAPGGKTTLLSAMLHPDSLIVANEVIKTRVSVLTENVQKWGLPNVWVTNNDPSHFTPLNGMFDVVVVDAPCSGEGLFRKNPDAVNEWSEQNVNLCSARQRRILANAADLVKPGGVLLYSTCTFAPEENEENAAWLVNEQGFTPLRLRTKPDWGITETQTTTNKAQTVYGYRFYPHKTKGEGFFLACLSKEGDAESWEPKRISGKKTVTQPFAPVDKKTVPLLQKWLQTPDDFTFFGKSGTTVFAIPKQYVQLLPFVATHLIVKLAGVEMGIIKGNDLVPAPALALSTQVNRQIPRLPLPYEEAIQYLKKQDFTPAEIAANYGWTLATYQNHLLGWMKIMPGRWNNYFPTEWRIRK